MRHTIDYAEKPTNDEVRRVVAEFGKDQAPDWALYESQGRWRLDVRTGGWYQNRQTHRWVTLDGENYSCDWCDTKTGSEPCPGGIG